MYSYENKYPQENELVMVQIKSITDTGVYVSLLQYDGIEGMIAINELTNRRFRSYHKIVRIGRIEVAQVIAVDKKKGYIDLSKKVVSTEDIVKCGERWNKTKCVYTIMYDLSCSRSVSIDLIYEQIAWSLQRKYGDVYDSFLMYMSDPSSVPEIYSQDLIYNIKKRLQSKVSKIRTIIDVTCFQYEGIDAIKKALKCVYDVCPDISVSLIIPSFSLTLSTIDKEKGIQLINQACDAISKKIKEFGGDMTIREYPKDIAEESHKESFPSGKEDDNEDDNEDDEKTEY